MRRQTSRGRPSAKPSSMARRSRAIRSSSSDGASQCRCVVEAAQVSRPVAHRIVGRDVVGLAELRAQVAPATASLDVWKRNRSSSPQANSGVRSATRCGGGWSGRRRPGAPSTGRGPPASRRRASSTRPGRGSPSASSASSRNGQRRAGRDEDGDVAEPRRAPPFGAVVDAPSLVDRAGDRGGDVGRLGGAELVGAGLLGMGDCVRRTLTGGPVGGRPDRRAAT